MGQRCVLGILQFGGGSGSVSGGGGGGGGIGRGSTILCDDPLLEESLIFSFIEKA